MPRPILIGIDGGATHCRACVADEDGNVLGTATRRASANIASGKSEAVMAGILSAVSAAARRASLSEREWRRAHVGMGLAGADVKSKRDDLIRLLKQGEYFSRIEVRTDAFVTWLGAHCGADGAILILGTGSCGLAVVGPRQSYVSGFGPQVSDESSGHWLGRMAIRRALWAYDGRIERTPLADEILGRFHESPEEIVTFANSRHATPAAYGELAPLVFEHAGRGDALGVSLVKDAVADAERMIYRLLDLGAASVYLHGGLAEPLSRWMRAAVRKRLLKQMNVESIPLEGAILLAAGAAKGRRTGKGAPRG